MISLHKNRRAITKRFQIFQLSTTPYFVSLLGYETRLRPEESSPTKHQMRKEKLSQKKSLASSAQRALSNFWAFLITLRNSPEVLAVRFPVLWQASNARTARQKGCHAFICKMLYSSFAKWASVWLSSTALMTEYFRMNACNRK